MSSAADHRWFFFRAGGFDQVRLNSPADLQHLRELDQKLWAALACPVDGLEFDQRTLDYIDRDHDGRIRAPELLDAVDWTLERLADPGVLFHDDGLPLSALRDDDTGRQLAAAGRHLLSVQGRAADTRLRSSDTDDLKKLFPPDQPNGDGLVPAALTPDDSLKAAIADIIACVGAEKDRSGEDALSEARLNDFFAQAEKVAAWQRRRDSESALQPFGDATADAVAAIAALRDKIDDYFHRVQLAAFDPRALALMNGEEADLVRLAAKNLANIGETAHLPLADIRHGDPLPLDKGINPAWRQAVQAFRDKVMKPLLGDQATLTAADWQALAGKCAPHFAWQAERPDVAILEKLGPARIAWLVNNDIKEKLLALVRQDKAVSTEADSLIDLDKLLHFQQHLVTLLNNFISFWNFYTRNTKAVFQAGTLYIDGKSCELVVQVGKIDEHCKMAGASGSFLIYCECRRRTPAAPGEKAAMNIVAAVTAGDEGNLIVGRNGLFYDRDGHDWDAHVVKIIHNPISVREAFWLPYRRIGKMVSDQIQKFASARDEAVAAEAQASVNDVATQAGTAATGPAAAAARKAAVFDIAKFAGIFAALGLALGAITSALAAVMTGLLSLQWWQLPLVAGGVMLAISGPSMLLAWFKLRRRNLAPILDANGWAVNTQARISIGFGTALTRLAELPQGAERSLRDPYASESRPWPWIILALLAALLWAWRHQWLRPF